MGSLVVVNADELVEAFLLLQEVERSGLRRFMLQCQMHAFMSPVLLGVTRLDTLDRDTQSQPPDREQAESEEGIGRGEGNSVVGTYGIRQPELLEHTLKHGKGEVGTGRTPAPRTRAGSGSSNRSRLTDSNTGDCPA